MIDSEEELYEEYRVVSTWGSWWILILLSLVLVGTCMIVHHLIPDRPQYWDYGSLETIPGKSVYSTSTVRPTDVAPAETARFHDQLKKVPGAQPLEKLKPKGYEMGVK